MIILASASPRRADMLLRQGVKFFVDPALVDESPEVDEDAQTYVVRIAMAKVADRLENTQISNCSLILAADTCISVGDEILGKPKNFDHFLDIMHTLSGRTHRVLTGVAIGSIDTGSIETFVVLTDVRFRDLIAEELQAYWETGEPQDKAGGYAIQGMASEFIESIHGSYSNVVGLPLCETMQMLDRYNVHRILGPQNA